jgi:hypothetical protein
VILLSGLDADAGELERAGADAILRKPFSPLQLVSLLDQLAQPEAEIDARSEAADADQLLLYARDLNRLLEIERAQRRLLQKAYRQTLTTLANALEAKDPHTGMHAFRVHRYAVELTDAFDRELLNDPSLEYGFLLHDIGKIATPNEILSKQGPLTDTETTDRPYRDACSWGTSSRRDPRPRRPPVRPASRLRLRHPRTTTPPNPHRTRLRDARSFLGINARLSAVWGAPASWPPGRWRSI